MSHMSQIKGKHQSGLGGDPKMTWGIWEVTGKVLLESCSIVRYQTATAVL